MTTAGENLHDRLRRLGGERRTRMAGVAALVVVPVLVLMMMYTLTLGVNFLFVLFLMLLLVCPYAVLYVLESSERRSSRSYVWEWERLASLVESMSTDTTPFPAVDRSRYPGLASAIQMYQAAVGTVTPFRCVQLARSTYPTRIDACVRLDDDLPVIYFTHALLETFSRPQLLSVIAHMLARHELMLGGYFHAVLEADARALMITRDPEALLTAIEAARSDRVPRMPRMADPEAWFADDEGRPDSYIIAELPWARINRCYELRKHLGAMGIEK